MGNCDFMACLDHFLEFFYMIVYEDRVMYK